jgi:hypothetical protein
VAGALAPAVLRGLRRRGPAPVIVYFAVANLAGLVVTAALKLA